LSVEVKIQHLKEELDGLEALMQERSSFSPTKNILAQIILFAETCAAFSLNVKAGACLVYAYEKEVFQSSDLVEFLALSKPADVYDLFRGSKEYNYRDLIKRIGSDGGLQGNCAVFTLTKKGKLIARKITRKMKIDVAE
jgi:hypothetical protein